MCGRCAGSGAGGHYWHKDGDVRMQTQVQVNGVDAAAAARPRPTMPPHAHPRPALARPCARAAPQVVRSADQIRAGMGADEGGGGADRDDPNLVAYWKFDEGKGYSVKVGRFSTVCVI